MTTENNRAVPMPNVELLDAVLDVIEKKPERWNQKAWRSEYSEERDSNGEEPFLYMEKDSAYEEVEVDGTKVRYMPIQCNTAFCFAGHAVVLGDPKALWLDNVSLVATPEDSEWLDSEAGAEGAMGEVNFYIGEHPVPYVDADFRAQRLLGLTYEEAESLFDANNSLETLKAEVEQIKARAAQPVS